MNANTLTNRSQANGSVYLRLEINRRIKTDTVARLAFYSCSRKNSCRRRCLIFILSRSVGPAESTQCFCWSKWSSKLLFLSTKHQGNVWRYRRSIPVALIYGVGQPQIDLYARNVNGTGTFDGEAHFQP